MTLKLYFDVMSQPSRALLLFLRVNSIAFQEVPVALGKREHFEEKFKEVNPLRKIPVIDHDGFKLTESVAILRYLCRTFPVPEHWYPKESKLMTRVDEYMSWQHLNLRAFGSMFFQSNLIIPRSKGIPPVQKDVEFFQGELEKVLEQIETIWLKENEYIAGKDLTIADLLAVTELEQPGMAGFDVKKGRPILSAYMELVRTRLQPHYDEVHTVPHKISKKALAKGSVN